MLEKAKLIEEQIIADRRVFHQEPEMGLNMPKTVAYVKKRLIEMGYEPQDCGKAGVVATVGKPGKCFLIRGDMDALPMMEETGLPFASTNGATHSCGHDAHTAMLLGAAQLLKDHEAELNGTVKLMFQPAEEILAGANDMIANGVLENPKVDAAYAIHVNPEVPTGKVQYAHKYVNASADAFTISITGKGGHGAMPENAIDPLVCAAYIVIAMQEIQAREVSGREMAVVTFGVLQSGEKENIIPSTAQIRGTVRTFDSEVLARVKRRMEEISKGVGLTFRCDVNLNWDFGCAPNSNDEVMEEEFLQYHKDVLGEDSILAAEASMGSEDFASVSSKVPSVYVFMGVKPEGLENVYPIHNPRMIVDEEALHKGAALYAHMAAEWLKNNG